MAKQLRQARAVLRAARNYLRHDLPEIVFPSSLPNPPGYVPEPRKSHRELLSLFFRNCRRYLDTWDAEKMRVERRRRAQEAARTSGSDTPGAAAPEFDEGPSLASEFAAAAKGGTQALKPFLANLYQTRVTSYKNAVQQFVEGYKQGFQQAMRPEVPPGVAGEMHAAAAAPTGGEIQPEATSAAGTAAGGAAASGSAAQGFAGAGSSGGEGPAAAASPAGSSGGAAAQQAPAGSRFQSSSTTADAGTEALAASHTSKHAAGAASSEGPNQTQQQQGSSIPSGQGTGPPQPPQPT